ncbi:MAG: iron-sulfur cluster assembly scaffold protein [Woeseiaceae bacterium]|nr:iron-sulfur cluster assembly scaffold protein [Woeseiaceae bacterium]
MRHVVRIRDLRSPVLYEKQLSVRLVSVWKVRLSEGTIKEYSFTAEGCAISIASASILGDLVQGMTMRRYPRIRTSVSASIERR